MCVIFDTGERIYIHEKILAEYHLKEGMNVPAEAVEEMVSANGYRRARERALYLFGREGLRICGAVPKAGKELLRGHMPKGMQRACGTAADRRQAVCGIIGSAAF